MAKQTAAYLIMGSLAVMSLQCGGDQQHASQAAPLPPSEPMPAEPSMTPASRATPPPSEEQTAPPETQAEPAQPAVPEKQALSDEQIAAVTDAANDAEIAQAKIAQKSAKNARVKKFAAMMIKDHTAAGEKLSKLATSKKVVLPTELLKRHQMMLDGLKEEKGADFDSEYRMKMVASHKEAVSLFDHASKKSPDPEIRAFAAEMLPKLQEHGAHAKKLEDSAKKKK